MDVHASVDLGWPKSSSASDGLCRQVLSTPGAFCHMCLKQRDEQDLVSSYMRYFLSVLMWGLLMSLHALELDHGPDVIKVDLGNGVRLHFALDDGWLLGLHQTWSGDRSLRSDQTVLRPMIAQEYGSVGLWPFLRLESVAITDGALEISCRLYGSDRIEDLAGEFVITPDLSWAMHEGETPDLARMRQRLVELRPHLDPLVDDDPAVVRIARGIERMQRQAAEWPEGSYEHRQALMRLPQLHTQMQHLRDSLYQAAAVGDPELEALAAEVSSYHAAVRKRAAERPRIHRDYYDFAHLRLPAESCQVEDLRRRRRSLETRLQPGGRLTWIFRPQQRVIAGWSWAGWDQSYRVHLDDVHQTNVLRQVGTWEIDGDAVGLTVVNMRYRGLGGIEQTFQAAADGTGVAKAWSTTEILPGAAGSVPAVSPVVPASHDESLSDRGYAVRHRLGAWISKMARGGGTGFVDFQHREGLFLISYHERQGALRALTEIFPGDRQLSQTDEQWFANSNDITTEPQLYLTLNMPVDTGHHEMVTRWQEVDRYVRDVVSEHLGFVQTRPLPAVGWLHEVRRPEYYRWKAEEGARQWYAQGVRTVITHTPGWYTEQHRNGPHEPSTITRMMPYANSNRVFDWVITDDVRPYWRRFQEICAELGMTYHIYLGGMVRPDGPFAMAVGQDPALWGMNRPHHDRSHGYPPLAGHNLHAPGVEELLSKRLFAVQDNLGMQGLWCDSWQNMFLSQLNWGDGSGAPMQERWWPLVASWSRRGIHLMAESHAFPGLSCSIEVSGWEDAYHYFPFVTRWHRGTSQRNYDPERHNIMSFRFMANMAWLAPDGDPLAVPDFPRLSAEYRAAMPIMDRSWVLPEGAGVLWCPAGDARQGVWFSYHDGPVPPGIGAHYILDEPSAGLDHVRAHRTYRVSGDDLPRAFGMMSSPLADLREPMPVAEAFHYPDP